MSREFNFFEKNTPSSPTRREEILQILEGLLFSSSEPISLAKLREIINTTHPVKTSELKALVDELRNIYQKQKRAFKIDEIAEGYLLRTIQEMHPYIEILHQNRRAERLSKAATEVLAIIAYKQPITRAQIEVIRGVDCSGTISSLLERRLIETVGRLETAGRPLQYGITARFLQYFGFKNVDDLNSSFQVQK